MKATPTIIVPIDFLDYSDKVVDYALTIGQKLEGKLHFVHVVEEANIYGYYMGPTIKHFMPKMKDLAQGKMDVLMKRHGGSGVQCSGKVLTGEVVENIIAFAEEKNGDMIIIGTHGRKGLQKIWLGSVAERVVKNAPCPTLTYNPQK